MALISDLRVAILVDNGVTQEQVVIPREYLEKSGIRVDIVSPQTMEVATTYNGGGGTRLKVDASLPGNATGYSCVVLPDSKKYEKRIRFSQLVLSFLKDACQADAIIAVIGSSREIMLEPDLRDVLIKRDNANLIVWENRNLEALAQQIIDRLSAGLHDASLEEKTVLNSEVAGTRLRN